MKNFWRGNNVWKGNNKTKKNKSVARFVPQSKSKLNYNAENIERIYGPSNDPKPLFINNGKPMLVLNSDPSSLQENVNLKPSLNVGSYKWAPKEEYSRVRKALPKNGYVTPFELQHLSGRNLGFRPSENIYESVPRTPPSKKKSPWRFWSRSKGGAPENNDDPKPRANMNRMNKTFKNIQHRWKEYFPNKKNRTRKEIIASNVRNILAHGKRNLGFRPKNDNKYLYHMSRMKPFYTKSMAKDGGGIWSPFSRGSQKKVLKSTPPIYELEEVVVHDPNARPVLNVNEYMETNWPEEYYKLRKRMPKGSKVPKGFESWSGENLGFVPGETKRKRRGRSRSKNSNNNND